MPSIVLRLAFLAAEPADTPRRGRAVFTPSSGRETTSSPRAILASVSRAMSACFFCMSEISIDGTRRWSDSIANRNAQSFSSGGIFEWSASSAFSPLVAISTLIRATTVAIMSTEMSRLRDLNASAFNVSSCGLFRASSRSSGKILIHSMSAWARRKPESLRRAFYYAPSLISSLRTPSSLAATMLE